MCRADRLEITMRWMVALREHGYTGRRITVGTVYPVRTEADAAVLKTARLARDAKKSEIPVAKSVVPTMPTPQPPPPPLPSPLPQLPIIPAESAQLVETRVEEPELENEGEGDDDQIVYETTSPKEDQQAPEAMTRRQRRRYNRKDMVSGK